TVLRSSIRSRSPGAGVTIAQATLTDPRRPLPPPPAGSAVSHVSVVLRHRVRPFVTELWAAAHAVGEAVARYPVAREQVAVAPQVDGILERSIESLHGPLRYASST